MCKPTVNLLGSALLASLFLLFSCSISGGGPIDHAHSLENTPIPKGCTSIMVGRLASADGSVITSHTCDYYYRTWVTMDKARKLKPGKDKKMPAVKPEKVYKGMMHNEYPGDQRGVVEMGEIPGVKETYAFLNTAYPCMNEYQLAMGESTFGGRKELQSKKGIFYIEELQRIALQRTKTARAAIRLIGELAVKYGYADSGEALTIADPKEVWHLEIMGPGKDKLGAVWAAVRIPDDHVGVAANICRISEIDLSKPDYYMASKNVHSLAQEMGWYDPAKGKPFKFWQAYGGRKPFTAREFYIFNKLAPGLKLDFDKAEEMPFSVKPEKKVAAKDIFLFFRDSYEGSRFDLLQNLKVKNKKTGKLATTTFVHPWQPRAKQALFNALKPKTIEFHRTIPVMYNAYHTVIQCRDWLPDPIGGLCWLGFDNPANTPRAPIFCGVRDLPADFKVCNQHHFRRDSAAWAFRRASRLICMRWGANKEKGFAKIRQWEEKAAAELPGVEKKALELYQQDPEKARVFLTEYTNAFCRAMTHQYWEFGDKLWMNYRFFL